MSQITVTPYHGHGCPGCMGSGACWVCLGSGALVTGPDGHRRTCHRCKGSGICSDAPIAEASEERLSA